MQQQWVANMAFHMQGSGDWHALRGCRSLQGAAAARLRGATSALQAHQTAAVRHRYSSIFWYTYPEEPPKYVLEGWHAENNGECELSSPSVRQPRASTEASRSGGLQDRLGSMEQQLQLLHLHPCISLVLTDLNRAHIAVTCPPLCGSLFAADPVFTCSLSQGDCVSVRQFSNL